MKAVRFVLKGVGYLFLIWLGLHLWFALSPLFLPDSPTPPGTFAGVRQELEGLAEARRAGPEAEVAFRRQLDRSRPFDNSLIIAYIFPVILVRLLCAAARGRQLSPLAIFMALSLIWFAVTLVVQAIGLVVPHAGSIWGYAVEQKDRLSDKLLWQIGILAAAVVITLIWRSPRFLLKLVWSAPRRVDRAFHDLLDEEEGWLARNNGPDMARMGKIVVVAVITGLAGWTVWRLCDGLDGGGVPDAVGVVARLAAVAYATYLLYRTHGEIAGQRTIPEEETSPLPQAVQSRHSSSRR